MQTTLATKGHTPAVSGEPAMSFSGPTVSDSSLTLSKGMEVTFHTRRVHEKMSIGGANMNEPIGISDKAATAHALIGFGTIATYSFQRGKQAEHFQFRFQADRMVATLPNS
jgi:hypothetical protein